MSILVNQVLQLDSISLFLFILTQCWLLFTRKHELILVFGLWSIYLLTHISLFYKSKQVLITQALGLIRVFLNSNLSVSWTRPSISLLSIHISLYRVSILPIRNGTLLSFSLEIYTCRFHFGYCWRSHLVVKILSNRSIGLIGCHGVECVSSRRFPLLDAKFKSVFSLVV